MRIFAKFLRARNGAVSLEYAMIGALISILILSGASSIGNTVSSMFIGPIGTALGGGGSTSSTTPPTTP